VAIQSNDKYSLAASQFENQRTNHLKCGYGYGGSSCTPPGKPACSSSSPKSHYTNAHSMGNKQEGLDICVWSQSHDLIAITETWWDSSHDWHAVIDGYRLFRKDRPTRQGGKVALHVREQLECIKLCLEERVESLRVRIKGQANTGDTVAGVYYRPSDQEEEVDEASYRQLKVASRAQALVLMRDFNYTDICWKDHTARHTESRRFLQGIDDNFLTQVVDEPTRKVVLLDLLLTNTEGPVEDVKAGGSLGCRDHEMVEFRNLHGGSRAISSITILHFRRANIGLFKDLLGGISWVTALEGRGVQESWSLFKHYFLHAQDQCIPMSKNSRKGGRRPAWTSKKLLAKLDGLERSMECGKRDRPLGRNRGTLSEHAGKQQESLRSSWN